jgi:hypothetical protein
MHHSSDTNVTARLVLRSRVFELKKRMEERERKAEEITRCLHFPIALHPFFNG